MSEFYKLYNSQNENATAKIALHIDVGVIQFNDANPQRYIFWHNIPNYSLQVLNVGFVLTHNNFFYDILNQMVQKLLSAGLIDKIIYNCVPFVPYKFSSNKLIVFDLKSLSFGFVIWFGCIVICLTVYLLEVMTLMWSKTKISMNERKSKKNNRKDATTQTDVNQDEIAQFVITLFTTIDKNISK